MSSSYTLDFTQYSLTDGGTVGTFNQHNLSTIFHGDWKFEDISSTDTGGLTAWGEKIEILSQSDTNWTIVRLSNKNGYNLVFQNDYNSNIFTHDTIDKKTYSFDKNLSPLKVHSAFGGFGIYKMKFLLGQFPC